MSRFVSPAAGKSVILVNGVPASGKSTVARALSQRFALPYLTLDGIKEPFMSCLGDIDRAQNRALGCAAYQAIWSVVAQGPQGCAWVIDAWFGFQPREALSRYLREAGVTQVLEVWNQVSGALAAERYASRLGQRVKGHPGEEYLPELRALAERATPMALGPVFLVEQGPSPDIDGLADWLAAHATQRDRRPGCRCE
ncbi:AAA family ATPase [Serratia ficaria]|uniref:AAA family ATPase n=1 Tax=Serratia ficaria TaxID=61651 RepID=A0A240C1Q8_SERFI|nr:MULTISPECIES: AAA family ATPase [Serratia]MEE4484402.1 AAA family ATPase [Serratia ficaria]REF44898.1 adenylate kinase family enzyme [Serratia ficaria]CAI0746836.1 Uncharacterised protein [Serratia ficaria]CAI0836143.1 Uncharacterised protein [Serratia ficaria]CAI0887774.1 Uncharacterised protein [Serratia ficaria]